MSRVYSSPSASMTYIKVMLTLLVQGNVLIISSATLDWTAFDTKVYDVRDIIDAAIKRNAEADAAGGANQPSKMSRNSTTDESDEFALIQLIQNLVDPGAWSRHQGDGDGIIRIWSGRLFVCQSPAVQKDVEAFLKKLREPAGKP